MAHEKTEKNEEERERKFKINLVLYWTSLLLVWPTQTLYTNQITQRSILFSKSQLQELFTPGTDYSSTVKPYQKGKNGRAAWLLMVSSHAGQDKWEQMQKDKMKFIMNTKWNGCIYSLEKFTRIHRTAYVQLEEASIHVNFQLPTEHTRVGTSLITSRTMIPTFVLP